MFTNITGRITWQFHVSPEFRDTPITGGYSVKPILPRTVEIVWYPETIFGDGEIRWNVKVTGQQVKKDGTESATSATHDFAQWRHEDDPEVVTAIVELTRSAAQSAIRTFPRSES